MSTKTMKILMFIATAVLVMAMGASVVYGANFSPTDVKANTSVQGTEQIKSLGGNIVGIIQTVGIVLAVVILMILGIKYMMGSAEEKAEYKKTMIPYIIGAVLIFAASNVAGMIYDWASTIK